MTDPRRLRGYLLAILVVAAATLVGSAAGHHASLADEAMLYALAILVAAHAGRGPGLVAAALSVGAFDFFFVEPKYTLDVADSRFLITFAVMFAGGAAIGGLGSRLRDRERTTAALLAFTRDAAAASDEAGVRAAVERHVKDVVGGRERMRAEDQPFIEAVERQAAIAIEKLRLARAASEAEVRATQEKLRTALLSAVSHDLRTPLAVIVGMATTLRETAPVREHDGLDEIVSEAARLSRILENLLAVTKVEAGAKPRREWVPIEELVGAALARTESSIAGRAVSIAIPGDLLAHVDPILGELLLVNLLDNAAKYTPTGTPLELTARREENGAVIELADRGPGLPEGTERLVFERFFRAAPQGTAGVGLGLAVCRGIVEAHEGTIEARAREGGGAVFRVTLPDAEPPPQLQALEAAG
jgi:K+-sensing histidine kinase KdpD